MKKISETKKVTEYVTEKYELDKNFTLKVQKIDGELVDCSLFKGDTEYFYTHDGDKLREFFRNHPYHHDDFESIFSFMIEGEMLFDHISTNGFDCKNAFQNCDSHDIKDSNGKWIDMLIELDYIQGFRQKNPESDYEFDWDWKALGEHLKASPFVKRIEEKEIPHYNRAFYGQKYYDISIVVPEFWRNYDKDGWDSTKIILSYVETWKDHLCVKQFLNNKK